MPGPPKGTRYGGRVKGVPNKATAKREAEIRASGLTPLDYMLKVMRNPKAPPERRDDMAKAAAPYVHPKLSNVAHSGKIGTWDASRFTDEQLAAMDSAISGALAASGGNPEGDPG